MEAINHFIQGVSGLLTALLGLVVAISGLIRLLRPPQKSSLTKDPKSTEPDEITDPRIKKIKEIVIPVVFLALGVSVAAFIFWARAVFSTPPDNQQIASAPKTVLSPPPDNQSSSSVEPHQSNVTVEIDPITDNQISPSIYKTTGAGSFTIKGDSSGVYSTPNLRIYVLVHPMEPSAYGWYVQRPVSAGKDGKWQSEVWHGGGTLQPQPGHKIEIVAAVAPVLKFDGVKHVNEIQDIAPVTQTSPVEIRIASLK